MVYIKVLARSEHKPFTHMLSKLGYIKVNIYQKRDYFKNILKPRAI